MSSLPKPLGQPWVLIWYQSKALINLSANIVARFFDIAAGQRQLCGLPEGT